MKVPLLDLKAQYDTIRGEIKVAIEEVLESQHFILGPAVGKLEAEIAEYVNAKYAVGVASGSDALLLALMAVGIRDGDEVITTPYTFFATVGAIARLNAKSVFVDIEPKNYNIDPGQIEAKITKRTKAIIPVHLYGQSAEMDEILKIAKRHGVKIIEDAAQAIGTEYKGRRVGSIGDFGCFSFFPSKNLGGFGDGGIITTNNDEYAEKLKVLRVHGSKPKYYHKVIGCNSRLDAIQAAIISTKLRHLDKWTEGRRKNAELYNEAFMAKGVADRFINLPNEDKDGRHIYNQYVLRVKKRDELMAYLKVKEIGTEVYYPLPLHLQECFSCLGYKQGDFPISESAAQETVAIPVYPELTETQHKYVVNAICEFYHNN